MKKFTLLLTIAALTIAALTIANVPTEAKSSLNGYVRAREFVMRFANIISSKDEITYTIGRDDRQSAKRSIKPGEVIPRLEVKSGSRRAYVMRMRDGVMISKRVLNLERGVKVDGTHGLLIPPRALRSLGCTVGTASSKAVRVTCDGVTYNLAMYQP
jgi:hypothetical protein